MDTYIFLAIILILVADFGFERYLAFLNIKYAKKELPAILKDIYNPEKYAKQQDYFTTNARFGMITSSFSFIITLLMFSLGGFAFVDNYIQGYVQSPIWTPILFFGVLYFVNDIISIPFEWYDTFVIEQKFEFNKVTPKLFFMDKLKGYGMTIIMGGGILFAIIWIYNLTPQYFWFWAWVVITSFSLFMNMFYSEIIVPLFNKQTPLMEGELRTAIEKFAAKSDFNLSNIFVIDGSKRSTKANAYFIGLGSKKRIVLYDTLMDKLTTDEIVAVLAHEVGHYKHKHTVLNLAVSIPSTLLLFFIFGLILQSDALAQALGGKVASFHLNAVAFSILYSPISLLLDILTNVLSRKFEYQADAYAAKFGYATQLESGLKKLSVTSLSNLMPHPLSVFFHYSHPTLYQRISKLNEGIVSKETNDTVTQSSFSYAQTLQYLYDRLPVFHQVGGAAYKPGLDNSIFLMNELDNPQTKYKTIHVAGTNGKGSVSHLLAAILQKSGYKVGLYTSPHLVDFGERIRVDGQMIEQQYVIDFVAKNDALFSKIEPSFFEATMAMAFDYFAFCAVDVAIIEVGLGGRLDSTNIIQPELSVITNISFDHVQFLGDTLEKIAAEKAGIIKRNTSVVIGESIPDTRKVFEAKAKEMNAPLFFAEEKINVSLKGIIDGKMMVETSSNAMYTIGLCGNYQLKNIATVLAAVVQLKTTHFDIPEIAIKEGLEHVTSITGFQGRWQVLQQSPMVVCDTAHNLAGVQFVVDQLKLQKFKSLHVVIGVVNDKDISSVLALLPTNAKYYFTQANIARALPADNLKEKAQAYGLNGESYKNVKDAVNLAIENLELNDLLFIGGSNFVVGEAIPIFKH